MHSTGADLDRRGLVAEANCGTLFLDEIDELPPETQVALLGVLQDKRFRRIGADDEQEVDLRVICASNQDVTACLTAETLRTDFYHRVAHFIIELPPLRERKGDLEPLARTILDRFRDREQMTVLDLATDALEKLAAYDWPGNVRELESVVEGGGYRAQFDGRARIEPHDLSLNGGLRCTPERSFHEQVNAFKLGLVNDSLTKFDGNQVQAAA